MFVTPEQAAKEACPHIRYLVNFPEVINDRQAAIYEHQNCQGPACRMAWRWEPGNKVGFCGIAGRP